MSLIVSRSIPFFGSVSDSKERRWISIRWGTSTGVSRRENDRRVTGAAGTLANWATPQVVEEQGKSARVRGQDWANGARPSKIAHKRARPQGPATHNLRTRQNVPSILLECDFVLRRARPRRRPPRART